MSLDLSKRIAELSPEQRELLLKKLAAESAGDTDRAIPRISRDQRIPLSFAQERLWFLEQLEPGTAGYNIPAAVRLTGHLDVDSLHASLIEIQNRHEALRTTIVQENGDPRQLIADTATVELTQRDLASESAEHRESLVQQIAAEEAQLPFNLEVGPLFRCRLLVLDQQEHVLLVTMHHIVSDAWSISIFYQELFQIYNSLVDGRSGSLPELPVQYADFAVWQRQQLQGELLEKQLDYWRKHLFGAPTVLELPKDRGRPRVQSYHGAMRSQELPRDLSKAIGDLGRRQQSTLFMVLLAAFQALLMRYSGEQDVVVGSTIAGRPRPELEPLVGFFVNTLALRTDLSGNPSFLELLTRVRGVCLAAYANQDVPFAKLVEELRPERNRSHSPLIQVMLSLQNVPDSRISPTHLSVEGLAPDWKVSKFDLTLYVIESPTGLIMSCEYNTDLFDGVTIDRMLCHYERLLESVVSDPDVRIGEATLLDGKEHRQLLFDWNRTEASWPGDGTIHQLFERQAELRPDQLAATFEEGRLTYAQLNSRADQLAGYLRQQGLSRGDRVGIYLDRSLDMLVSVLGVLKAGGTYVPLDPGFPSERLNFMVRDSGLSVLLSDSHLADQVDAGQAQVVQLDVHWESISQAEVSESSAEEVNSDDVAYVIYTSGSTGQPKGVEIRHGSVVNFLCSMQREPGFGEQDRMLAVTTLSFDISVLELLLPLVAGGQVLICSRDVAADGRRLAEAIEASRPTVMQATPATWRMLLDVGWRGDPDLKVLCGGEALPNDLAGTLLERVGSLWNMYGPTETTVWSACGQITDVEGPVTVGRPIANTQIYILDGQGEPAPIGVAGRLHIGGRGLARGYWQRPQLTAEKFIERPRCADLRDGRLYDTGDVARYRSDGRIEVLGREDGQVKLRGFRIELGEIESALCRIAGIGQSVVTVRTDRPGDPRLVAYLVCDEKRPEPAELRQQLRRWLPEYMVPAHFVDIQKIPLLPNGKIDRKILPVPTAPSTDADSIEMPANKVERQLKKIWEELLDCEPVGVTSDFFELGGHSLMAVKMFARIEKYFGKRLPVDALFDAPTIRHLATRLQQENTLDFSPSVVVIQSHGSKPPLFLVPPSASPSLVFARLGRALGEDQPLYGLTPPTIDNNNSPRHWFEKTAEHFVASLRAIQPAGPYHLGGRCFGGFIAFEMAQQLVRQGEKVNMLLLMDVGPPLTRSLRFTLHRLMVKLRMIRVNNRRKRIHNLPPVEYLVIPYQPIRFDIVPARRRHKADQDKLVWDANLRAAAEYVTKPYAGSIALLQSRDHDDALTRKEWSILSKAGLEYAVIDEGHKEMLHEPMVHKAAQEIKRLLERSASN